MPEDCVHNAHMYYVILSDDIDRQSVLDAFRAEEIRSVFHYVPLHSSPAGRRYGRVSGSLRNTNRLSERLVRLPMWVGLTQEQQKRTVDVLRHNTK